jgi:uncharacterized protein YcnI
MTRSTRSLIALAGIALVAALTMAAPAGAHATARAEGAATAAADGRTRVTLTVEHGCGDEPTTTFKVQTPEGATDVRPENPAGWTSSVLPDQVVWSGGSLPGEGSFTLELVLAQPAGTTVVVPAVQQCPSGAEEAWIQLPEADGSEPEFPAPTFVVPVNATSPTSAAVVTSTTEPGPTTSARMALEQTPITQEGSEASGAGLIVFIVIVVVIVGGAAILYLRHRSTGNNGDHGTTGS